MKNNYLTTALAVIFSMIPILSSAQYLVGYHHNWNDGSAPYIALDQIDSRYTVVNLAFPTTVGGTDYDMTYTPCCGETQAGLITKIQTLQAAGVKVNVSIGGATVPIHLDNTTEVNTFVSSMNNIINTYGLDGIDIDLEGSSLSVSVGTTIANPTDVNVVNMIAAIQQIMADYQTTYSKKIFLSSAPETAFVQGGQGTFGGIWGAYLPLLEALRPDMDLLHVQLYNSGSMFGLDGNIYAQSTADFIVSQVEVVIQGFTVAGGAGDFTGYNPTQVSVGLPACPSAAGGGFTNVTAVKSAVDYLTGNGPKSGSYTLQGGPYPNLGGLMTWSVNWDAVASCNSSAYEFAASYEDVFGAGLECAQPNLGSDISACSISYPYTLNSNTPTHPDVTFTWTNLSTGQIALSGDATATTFNINEAGNYQVQRDSADCLRTDQIEVLNNLPEPELPIAVTLCATLPYTLSPSNTADLPVGTTFQWYQDNVLLSGETSSNIGNIREAGDYKLIIQNGSCNAEKITTITSGAPTPIDGCASAGSPVDLSITSASGGPFSWYENTTDGASISSGMTYTTPALNNTTTYYVEDESSLGTATTGPEAGSNGLGTLQNFAQGTEVIFDAAATFTLQEITVYPQIFCFTHTVSFEIQNSVGTVLTNGSQSHSVTDDTDCSTVGGPVVIILSGGGVEIPQGAGYKIVKTGSIGFNHWQGSVTYPMGYSPYFNITGTDTGTGYPALHDWKVTGGNCARMPVIATIDPMCAAVLPVELTQFSARLEKDFILLEWETENERDNAGFELERKTENEQFQSIAWLPAGEEIQNYYNAKDFEIEEGKTYQYRLKQIDLNGQFTYSKIETVKIASQNSTVVIYPNPTRQTIFVERQNSQTISSILRIYSPTGKLFIERKINDQKMELNLSSLSAGIYFLEICDVQGAREIRKKLIKE
ncbi:MAG: chitinase [Saprospiraceae bacterium]|jgi:chitinase